MIALKTTPMTTDWKRRLRKRNRDIVKGFPAMAALRKKILSVAGEEVCLPDIEDDLTRLLARGEVSLGKGAILKKGEPCQCHRNSARLWEALPDKLSLCTGYGLSKDGAWRQHSWCVFNGPHGSIVETTVVRLAYFGYRLTQEEAEAFLSANY